MEPWLGVVLTSSSQMGMIISILFSDRVSQCQHWQFTMASIGNQNDDTTQFSSLGDAKPTNFETYKIELCGAKLCCTLCQFAFICSHLLVLCRALVF